MAQTIRVSLPGYDALTETNPDHFALYADEDWVLIKEYVRSSVYVEAGQERGFLFYLPSYIPVVFAYYQDQGVWKICTGQYSQYGDFTTNDTPLPYMRIFSNELIFKNPYSYGVRFNFFICWDAQT
jgi:hypothetical protein